jgi:hypothetical protein
MPYQVDDDVLHAMSGTGLSRARTELLLLSPEPIKQSSLAPRGADISYAIKLVPVPKFEAPTFRPGATAAKYPCP